jgi:DNA-binding MarR family transcriptional regulator
LLALYDEGPLDQTALRERSGLEQSSLSRLVDGLAKRGLIELRPGNDRRVRIASITGTGVDLLHSTPGASELGGEIMVAGLSAEERRELIRLLRRCSDNLSGREMTETTHEGATGHDEWK